ncbi:LOW QUALITY PROTEIN: hypothetical protein HID58_047330, partial [Brassica napus]
ARPREKREIQFLRRSSTKITDNQPAVTLRYQCQVEILERSLRPDTKVQRTKVGLIDLVARKTQQLLGLNYESHIGKRFLVDTK